MHQRTVIVTMVFLFNTVSDIQVLGQTLDVCAMCHPNATCDDKSDHSGKVCNCMYGFVGNGRTFCQDKDECQIGTIKICGQYTSCHNTYGSYYCTCPAGYSPSNNQASFIPNDGTHCQDIDECKIQGICGEGGWCSNTEGAFDCYCQVGYQVQRGVEPFHPPREKALCKVLDCGQPPSVKDAYLLSATGTQYGSVALYDCKDGFSRRSGDNSSMCGPDGMWNGQSLECEELLCGHPPLLPYTDQVWNGKSTLGTKVLYFCKNGYYSEGENHSSFCTQNKNWTEPTLSCREILCEAPLVLPHTGYVWNGNKKPGTTVLYNCEEGFYSEGGYNVSVCTEQGLWTKPTVACKEVGCGPPPSPPHSMVWQGRSTVGSEVFYHCNSGYYNVGTSTTPICTTSGHWNDTSLLCQKVECGEPFFIHHSKVIWNNTTRIGTVVFYHCVDGYYTQSDRRHTICKENGIWEDLHLKCEEINCGPPPSPPYTNKQWGNTTRLGSVVEYVCMDGFYQESGNNMSTCSKSGEWGHVSIKCKAKCGPTPALANSEVVWHNNSVVLYRCLDGYHSWRGRGISVCDTTGIWQVATLTCTEIMPAITKLVVFKETCLRWKAVKHKEDSENYIVVFVGLRNFQRPFRDKRQKYLSSKADQLELCLNLFPVTNYTITVTAVSAKFSISVTTNTSLKVLQVPAVSYREVETSVPTLTLHRLSNTLDPISFFQVFVLPVEGTLVFDCASQKNPDFASQRKSHGHYITAQIPLENVGRWMNFTVGDGRFYGKFYNAPLRKDKDYYITLRVVGHWKKTFRHSCVLWAKVIGISHIIKVSSISTAGSVALFFLVLLAGYAYTWFSKKI